jgi:hypothetical protein
LDEKGEELVNTFLASSLYQKRLVLEGGKVLPSVDLEEPKGKDITIIVLLISFLEYEKFTPIFFCRNGASYWSHCL